MSRWTSSSQSHFSETLLANSSGEGGKNLHVHPASTMVAMMDEEVLIWKGATQGYYAHHPDEPEVLVETFSAPPDAMLAQSSMVGYDAVDFFPGGERVVAPADDAGAAAAVSRLARERKRAGGFVDKQTMRLRCKICGFIAEGDYEARAHAGGFGHKEFAPA